MRVAPAHERVVRQFVQDFAAVTGRWVAEGWHTPEEVEAWRREIRGIMQSENNADSDIPDLCRVWREIARKAERG